MVEQGWVAPSAPPDYLTDDESVGEARGGAPVPTRGVYLPPYPPSGPGLNRVAPLGPIAG